MNDSNPSAPRKKGFPRKTLTLLLIVALALVIALTGLFILRDRQTVQQSLDLYSQTAQTYFSLPQSSAAASQTTSSPAGAPVFTAVDLAGLKAVNPDVTAWIYQPDTPLCYPVLRCDSNDTYLRHTYTGEYNKYGSIFIDYRCASDFSGRNTLIYGHNMKNTAMFGSLVGYREQSYYDAHPTFTLYTESGAYTCEIFAAYETTAGSYTYVIDFQSDASFGEYVNYVTQLSLIGTSVTVGAGDRLITLSTCDYTAGGRSVRFVVQAVLRAAD